MTPLRVAIIGAGGIASRHVATLAWLPGTRIVAVADPVAGAAEGLARHVAGTRTYTDWRTMLDEVRPDALLICVPPFAHGEPELAAIERGIPFFTEKPIAADLVVAERIGAGLLDRPTVTAVGYHWRYLDITERAAEQLAEHPAELVMGYWWDATPPRSWWVRHATSGGQIVEQTTHLFDLARHLVGEAEVVSSLARHAARRSQPYPDADVADASLVTVVFDTGAIGAFASTHLPRWPHRIGLHLVSDGQVLELSEFELMIDVGRGRPVTRADRNPFLEEIRDFVVAAGGGENRIRAPFGEALRTQRLTTAATDAAIHTGEVASPPPPTASREPTPTPA